ncbi:hypothetical protein BJV74DRAFT_261326 [Russula compacta]|nr:hypothetical protein BJV74DRAFT_261326 [Russula compacta]
MASVGESFLLSFLGNKAASTCIRSSLFVPLFQSRSDVTCPPPWVYFSPLPPSSTNLFPSFPFFHTPLPPLALIFGAIPPLFDISLRPFLVSPISRSTFPFFLSPRHQHHQPPPRHRRHRLVLHRPHPPPLWARLLRFNSRSRRRPLPPFRILVPPSNSPHSRSPLHKRHPRTPPREPLKLHNPRKRPRSRMKHPLSHPTSPTRLQVPRLSRLHPLRYIRLCSHQLNLMAS